MWFHTYAIVIFMMSLNKLCGLCHENIYNESYIICHKRCNRAFHLRCAYIRNRDYFDYWTCGFCYLDSINHRCQTSPAINNTFLNFDLNHNHGDKICDTKTPQKIHLLKTKTKFINIPVWYTNAPSLKNKLQEFRTLALAHPDTIIA